MGLLLPPPGSRALRALDAGMVLWVLAWIGLGVAIGIEARQLTGLSHVVNADGNAVKTVGRTLSSLAGLPLVGHTIGHAAGQVQRAGANAASASRSATAAIDALSVLLAIAVALLPSIPVVGFYLPLRLQRRNECRSLRHTLRAHTADPDLQWLLAERALATLDYRRLAEISDAWGDLQQGRSDRLAHAELRRVGVDERLLAHRESAG